MKPLVVVIFFFMIAFSSVSQTSPVGVWQTIDDETGEAKSHVEIYEQNGAIYGKIVKLLKRDPGVLCQECPGNKKNRPVLGMVIIEGLQPHKDFWSKGEILDPESGNEYACSVWFENGRTEELKVRGKHWTGLYRTQTWQKVN